jgi:hypothetical protein
VVHLPFVHTCIWLIFAGHFSPKVTWRNRKVGSVVRRTAPGQGSQGNDRLLFLHSLPYHTTAVTLNQSTLPSPSPSPPLPPQQQQQQQHTLSLLNSLSLLFLYLDDLELWVFLPFESISILFDSLSFFPPFLRIRISHQTRSFKIRHPRVPSP